MAHLLMLASVAMAGSGGLLVCILTVRRLALGRREAVTREAETRLRPLALRLVEGERGEVEALSERDAQALARLLERYSRWLSGDARAAIAAHFDANGGVEHQIRGLRHRRSWRRAAAAHVLGDMASPAAVPALLDALRDPERDVRAAAARSLGLLGEPAAVAPLVRALAERTVPRGVTGQALLSIGTAAVPELVGLLGSTDVEVRAIAVELIGLLGDAAEAPAVGERLHDASAEVRAKAARALGRLGAEESTGAIRAALDDRIPFVRVAAATALGLIGDVQSVPLLLELAATDGFDPAQAAARAAARIDPDAVVEAAAGVDAPSPHVLEAADRAAARAT